MMKDRSKNILTIRENKQKRYIRPYKGGRTERIPLRVTPEEKERLTAAARALGMTLTDYILLLCKGGN